jgi:hypothetical protein
MAMAARRKDLQDAFGKFEQQLGIILPPPVKTRKSAEKSQDTNISSDILIKDPAKLGIAGRADGHHSEKSSIGGHQKIKKPITALYAGSQVIIDKDAL